MRDCEPCPDLLEVLVPTRTSIFLSIGIFYRQSCFFVLCTGGNVTHRRKQATNDRLCHLCIAYPLLRGRFVMSRLTDCASRPVPWCSVDLTYGSCPRILQRVKPVKSCNAHWQVRRLHEESAGDRSSSARHPPLHLSSHHIRTLHVSHLVHSYLYQDLSPIIQHSPPLLCLPSTNSAQRLMTSLRRKSQGENVCKYRASDILSLIIDWSRKRDRIDWIRISVWVRGNSRREG